MSCAGYTPSLTQLTVPPSLQNLSFITAISYFRACTCIDIHVYTCVCSFPHSGDVVTLECVDKLIRKSNMLCPITGQTLREKDIIVLQRVRISASACLTVFVHDTVTVI